MLRNKNMGLHAFIGALSVKLASLVKVSFIVGSYTAFFSGTSIAMPLVGAFGGFAVSCITFAMGLLITKTISFKLLAYHIPGLFAAWYWSNRSSMVRVVVPLVCFALFVTHPIGSQAWPYALYWLIPVALFYSSYSTTFATALGSTLVAHAVGSVIWLYTVPMTAQAWLALIPLVACERLIFATGMTVAHAHVVWFKHVVPGVIKYVTSLAYRKA